MIFSRLGSQANENVLREARNKSQTRLSTAPYRELVEQLAALPPFEANLTCKKAHVVIGPPLEVGDPIREAVYQLAEQLKPWKKGPFELLGFEIDAEWRSDLKWERLAPHLPDLRDKRLIDVGCNNGYYLLRLLEKEPFLLLGIDPTTRYYLQYELLTRYLKLPNLFFEPWGWQELAAMPTTFDCILNMGLLYHHRDPLGMLETHWKALLPGGTLFLETLVIPGQDSYCLFPPERYAMMKNVWFVPTVSAVQAMLARSKFQEIRLLDESPLLPSEQRTTRWNPGPSLADFLDPANAAQTKEGHPAPTRALFSCKRLKK